MNPKFVLPATFALTVHAFVLFGLSGKRPAVPVATEEPTPPTKRWLPIDNDDPIRVPKDGEGQTGIKNTRDVAPREIDVPRWDHKESDFVIAPLPPVESRGHPKAIPVDWVVPRALTSPSSGVVDLKNLDHVPRARLQTPPVYPAHLRHGRVEGTVVVEFLVDEAGNVYHAVVLSATTPGFEEAALRAVAKWRFEPGYRSGRRVHFRMSVPLVFRIADE